MEFGLRNYWTGHFTGNLGSAVRETVLAGFERRPAGTEAMILMESIHGQVHRIPDESAAFGQRAARWNVSPMTIWSDPADDAVHIGWARETAASLADHSLTGAGYVNYSPPDEPAERVRAAYGTARLERLVAVKRRMDPDNRFRFNHNIPPD
jgi:FAD/FMN-containing dehydrogenase